MFFSIVIPTRNRPHLLKSAIDSVLNQDFTDFELIISDNSNEKSSAEVRKLMSGYDDKRINYVRPPSELPMCDHWEWALNLTSGEYVSVLYDRAVFKYSALSAIHKEIITHAFPEAVVFKRDFLTGDDPPYYLEQIRHTDKVYWFSAGDAVDMFSKAIIPSFFPLMTNSFSKGSLQKRMRETFGAVFGGAPDPTNCFCYHSLDLIEKYLCIDSSFIILHGEKFSTGKYTLLGKVSETTKDYFKLMENKGGYKYTPIPMIDEFVPLPLNFIYEEYYMVKNYQTSGRFKEVDMAKLYITIMNSLDDMAEMSPEIMKSSRKAMEQFRVRHGIPATTRIKQTAKRITKKIKSSKRILRPIKNFILSKLDSNLFGAESGKTSDVAFNSIEEALEYDRKHPRGRSQS